jgi:GH24 family phage-related lysozyme (muramidase)
MKTNKAGLDLIKRFEGCRLKAYHLTGEKYNTIGWGHYGPDVTDGMMITQEQADKMLEQDLVKFEKYVEKYCTIPLTPNRNAALVSYTYNRGPGGMKQLAQNCSSVAGYSEGLVKYWGSATRYKKALVNRRKAEKAVFDLDANIGGGGKSVEELALEVLDGVWGSGQTRRANLTAAGYNYAMVQARVNEIIKQRKQSGV